MWAYYTGGARIDPVKQLDQSRLATLIDRLDRSDGSAPTDGVVTFHRDGFIVTPPQDGLAVDLLLSGIESESLLGVEDSPPLLQCGLTVRDSVAAPINNLMTGL